jgi:hypothetical protein
MGAHVNQILLIAKELAYVGRGGLALGPASLEFPSWPHQGHHHYPVAFFFRGPQHGFFS